MVVKSVGGLLYLKYAETSTTTSVVLFPAIKADLSRRDVFWFMLLKIYAVYIFIFDYDRRAEFFLVRDLFTHLKTNTNTNTNTIDISWWLLALGQFFLLCSDL